MGFGLTYVTLVVITGTLVPEPLSATPARPCWRICSFGAGAGRRQPDRRARVPARRPDAAVPRLGDRHRGRDRDRVGGDGGSRIEPDPAMGRATWVTPNSSRPPSTRSAVVLKRDTLGP